MQHALKTTIGSILGIVLTLGVLPHSAFGQMAYVTNASLDTVKVVDLRTNTVVGSAITVGNEPTAVATMPDGSKIFIANTNSGPSNGSISVIDPITRSVIQTISVTSGNPTGIAVSPDGASLYVTTDNGCTPTCPVKVYSTSTYSNTATIQVSGGQPQLVAFTPNGAKAYVVWSKGTGTNGGVAVISTTAACGGTPAPCVLGDVNVQRAPVGVAVSPDGAYVYVANKNSESVSYFSTSITSGTATNVTLPSGTDPQAVAFSPDSSTVYVTDTGHDAVYYFASNNSSPTISSISVGTDPRGIDLVPYTPFGVANAYGMLYVSTTSGLWAINPAINQVIASTSISSSGPSFGKFVAPPSAPSVSYVTNQGSDTLSVIDNATGSTTATISVGDAPIGSAVSPDLLTVLVTNYGGNSVSVIDAASNTVAHTLSTGFSFNQPFGVAITPDNTTAYVANQGNNTVTVIDLTTNPPSLGTTISSAQFNQPVGVAITPNGTTAYISNYGSGTVSVIPTATNTPTTGAGYPISVNSHPSGVAASPDGAYVYVANNSSNNISRLTVGSTTTTTTGGFNGPFGVAVTPDSSKVYVTNNGSGTVSVLTGGSVSTPMAASYPIGIATNSDGRRVFWANDIASGTLAAAATGGNTIMDTFSVQNHPQAFGKFIARTAWPFYAYITDQSTDQVSVIDTSTGDTVTTLTVGDAPTGAAISPNGKWVIATNYGGDSLSVIKTTTNPPSVNNTITLASGAHPFGVAFTPDNSWAYVTNQGNNTVSVINLSSNPPALYTTITNAGGGQNQFNQPVGVAITPDGTKAYVTNYGSGTVSVINTTTNGVVTGGGYPISVNTHPAGVVITPDGNYAYLANEGSNNLSKITVGTTTATTISNSNLNAPFGIAVTPDGRKFYITNNGSGTVSVMTALDSFTNLLAASYPKGVAVTPDGRVAYFANNTGSGTVSVVDTATDSIIDSISVGGNPQAFGMFIGR